MVISVASQKGGTGKTSTSISLAAGLAHKSKHVLLIDIDSQANSSKVLLRHYPEISKDQSIYSTILNRLPLVIHETHVPNLSIVPSHILLSNTDIELTTAKDHRESRLKTELDKVKSQYDYVFIDNPPALGWLTLNAFTASDRVLVVVSPGYFELDSLVQLPSAWSHPGQEFVDREWRVALEAVPAIAEPSPEDPAVGTALVSDLPLFALRAFVDAVGAARRGRWQGRCRDGAAAAPGGRAARRGAVALPPPPLGQRPAAGRAGRRGRCGI